MDTTTVVTNLTIDWHLAERTEDGRRLAATIAEQMPALDPWPTLATALRPDGPLDPTERHHLLTLLLELGRTEPLALRALLQGLLPGLLGLARRFDWGFGGPWGSPGQLVLELHELAYFVVGSWAGQHRPYAAGDILSAVRCRARRQLEAHREQRRVEVGLDLSLAEHPTALGMASTDEVLLGLAATSLPQVDATVVAGRLALGLTWAELEASLGQSRRRLEARLRAGARQLLDDRHLSSVAIEPGQAR